MTSSKKNEDTYELIFSLVTWLFRSSWKSTYLRDRGLGAEGGDNSEKEAEGGIEDKEADGGKSSGQGDDSGGNGGRCPSNANEANESDYDVARVRVLVQKSEKIEEPSGPLWRADASEDLRTFTILANLGKPCKITASDLELGATFENLSQAIEENPTNSVRILTISHQDLIATFKLPPETDEDREVHVKMRLSATGNASDCVIIFKVTKPVRYASSSFILGAGGQSTVFELEKQPPNCETLSPAQMGKFSILPNDPKGAVVLDYKDWLDSNSGRLTVNLPKMVNLPTDSDERTQRFVIKCKNIKGKEIAFDLVVDLVKFAFANIPRELIKGQHMDRAILLTSVPDILKDLPVIISDSGLPGSGFKISCGKLGIEGRPDSAFDAKVHIVKISCDGQEIPVKLPLPQVSTPAPPRPTPGKDRITFFELDPMIMEMKEAAAKQTSYQFEEHLLDRKLLLSLGSQGPTSHKLTLFINIQTEFQIDFDCDKLSALENAHVQIQRFFPMTDQWITVARADVNDFSITVKEGNLVITGNPIAHEGERDIRIDKSGLRGRHYIVDITPQNRAGDGEVVKLEIECLSVKAVLGVAQTYKFAAMRGLVGKLECCEVDLDGMIAVVRLLGFHILFTCKDTTVECINTTQRYFELLVDKVKTIEMVRFVSGRGFSTQDGTYLLVRNIKDTIDHHSKYNNLCIEDSGESIMKGADNSTYYNGINDLCRDPLPELIDKHANCKSGGGVASKKEPIVKPWFKQGSQWYSTRPGFFSTGALEPKKMSLYTGHLHNRLMQVAE